MKLKNYLLNLVTEICKRGLLLEGWNPTGMTTGSSVRRGENAPVRKEGEKEWALDLGLKTSGVLQAWHQNPEWTHDPTAGLWAPSWVWCTGLQGWRVGTGERKWLQTRADPRRYLTVCLLSPPDAYTRINPTGTSVPQQLKEISKLKNFNKP